MASIAVESHRSRSAARALDLLERGAVLGLFASFALRNYHAVVDQGHWFNAIMVASEALVALFILIRRPTTEVTQRGGDWALAFAATVGPLLAQASSSGHPLVPLGLGVLLLLSGLAFQVWAKLTLRRSFGIIPANRGVKASGPYRLMRHPMYLGYVTVHIGFLLLSPNLWNLIVYGLSFAVQIVRIQAEERLLSQDPAYAAFQARTRFRLVPGVF
ncbi:isoprenylcysteine carboxylmethyltransferase family protein [Caulobacter sp. S45]|uniref:methyltransferase family protein n=1 Tax=Caulobacter sp. S45 TaxID=1641861 RepID=UPI001575DE1B|nr:isoprenylcysteine carboxylmethyltransferase family protein [Caulobacter sp. S45]